MTLSAYDEVFLRQSSPTWLLTEISQGNQFHVWFCWVILGVSLKSNPWPCHYWHAVPATGTLDTSVSSFVW